MSFVICIFSQWISPIRPIFSIVVYRNRRISHFYTVFIAGSASFVGVVLMGVTLSTLRVGDAVDTRLNTRMTNVGGFISLASVAIGFVYGCVNMWLNSVRTGRIQANRSRGI